jgi:hypothetical protein
MPISVCSGRRGSRSAVLLVVALTGCGGGLYPVRGTVTLDDGTTLSRGLVVFERVDGGQPITARGDVKPDGSYQLNTNKPGDGVPPGRYKVLVNPLDLSDVPDEQKKLPFDVKYTRFETSGLMFEVKSGSNDCPIKLDRPKKK